MTETYKVIASENQLEMFSAWLPQVKQHEVYYVTLMSRSKYAPEILKGTTGSDARQLARFLTTPDRLIEDLEKLEVPLGVYRQKGVEVPQHAIAAYITPNPRNMFKALQELNSMVFGAVWNKDNHETSVNPVEMALTAVHKAVGSRVFVDFDFDVTEFNTDVLLDYVNPEALTILKTRGGFHALIRPELVAKSYAKTWYNNIAAMDGVDKKGTDMMPIPGCYQGGFVPSLSFY